MTKLRDLLFGVVNDPKKLENLAHDIHYFEDVKQLFSEIKAQSNNAKDDVLKAIIEQVELKVQSYQSYYFGKGVSSVAYFVGAKKKASDLSLLSGIEDAKSSYGIDNASEKKAAQVVEIRSKVEDLRGNVIALLSDPQALSGFATDIARYSEFHDAYSRLNSIFSNDPQIKALFYKVDVQIPKGVSLRKLSYGDNINRERPVTPENAALDLIKQTKECAKLVAKAKDDMDMPRSAHTDKQKTMDKYGLDNSEMPMAKRPKVEKVKVQAEAVKEEPKLPERVEHKQVERGEKALSALTKDRAKGQQGRRAPTRGHRTPGEIASEASEGRAATKEQKLMGSLADALKARGGADGMKR